MLVDNELTLVNRFGQPDSNTATSFFTAANFLAYGNNLTVVRAANTISSFNSTANSQTAIYVANPDSFQYSYYVDSSANVYIYIYGGANKCRM